MMSAILHRELSTILRARRMLFFQLGLIVVFVALVMIRWPSDNRVGLAGMRSQQVFRLFGYGLMSTLLLGELLFQVPELVSGWSKVM